jgi:hypothetical protein
MPHPRATPSCCGLGARPFEERYIKPYIIEFISIPSVVLGFFGIAMLKAWKAENANRVVVVSVETLKSHPGLPSRKFLPVCP